MPTKKTAVTPPQRPTLVVPLEEAQTKIANQIEKGEAIASTEVGTKEALEATESQYRIWRDYTTELLNQIATPNTLSDDFSGWGGAFAFVPQSLREEINDFRRTIQSKLEKLESIYKRLELLPVALPVTPPSSKPNTIGLLEQSLRRFHLVARQLRHRHSDRATLEMADEYDVQDLLYALLQLFFDDIRPEEWTPSYAGGSSRMDFLLKGEQIVIEVKKTRRGLADREIGNQLIIDAERYQSHQDCQHLICFVYDPDGHIRNPRGLERDLSRAVGSVMVKTIIAP